MTAVAKLAIVDQTLEHIDRRSEVSVTLSKRDELNVTADRRRARV